MERVRNFRDPLSIFLGLCFILWVCVLFIKIGLHAYREGVSFISLIYFIEIGVLFWTGCFLLNGRIYGVAAGGVFVFLYLLYDLIYPFAYFGFIPDGYFGDSRLLRMAVLSSILILLIYLGIRIYKRREPDRNNFDHIRVIKWSSFGILLVVITAFILFFFGFVGGVSIQGRLVDSETMAPIENGDVTVVFGSSGFGSWRDGSVYINGSAVTDENGYFYIENRRVLLSRLETSGFQRRVIISAKGYEIVSLVDVSVKEPGNARFMTIKMVREDM